MSSRGPPQLVAKGLESLSGLLVHLRRLLRLGKLSCGQLLALVVGSALRLASLLESVVALA